MTDNKPLYNQKHKRQINIFYSWFLRVHYLIWGQPRIRESAFESALNVMGETYSKKGERMSIGFTTIASPTYAERLNLVE